MPRIKLTEKAIERLPTGTGKQTLFWDDGPRAIRGFGVLCSGKTQTKTYVVQRDMPNGRTRRVTIAGVNELSLDAARKHAADVAVELRRGIDPKRKIVKSTLRQVLDAYRAARSDLRPRSLEHYASIERHLGSWFDVPMHEISRDMVETRHREIAAEIEGKYRTAAEAMERMHMQRAAKAEQKGDYTAAAEHRSRAKRAEERTPPVGHASANGAMRALRLLWNFAAERNADLPTNPVRLGRQWFSVARRERLVRADDLPAFYAAVAALPNAVQRDYLLLLLFTGLRRREAAGLRWDDVDLRGRVIRIPAVRNKARRKFDLPMSDFVRDLLIARRAAGHGEYVFPANSRSGHMEEPKFPLTQIAEASGIRISAHDLRRTFAMVAESTDISPIALKMLVNHSTGNDVTTGYVVLSTERLREAAQRVCNRMRELCAIERVANPKVAALHH
jgi:integrase